MLNFQRLTRSVFTAALAVAMIAIAAPNALAQAPRIGDRIRINTISPDAGKLTGIFQAIETEHIVLYTEESPRTTIAWEQISRLQISKGRHSNAGKGALIGFGVGGAVVLATAIALCGDDSGCEAGDVVLAVAATGAIGAVVGALIGTAAKSEKWQTVPRSQWQIRVAPDPKGGVAVGLNLRL